MTALTTVAAGTGAITDINDNFIATSAAGMYGRRAAGVSGLTWGYYGGRGFGNTVADGTVALTGSTTNYVVANRSTGAVSAATTTTNWNDTTNYYRLYLIVTGTSSITSATDYREFVGGSTAGAGTVTSVDGVNGVESSSGSAITSSGTLRANELVNAQTGTSYTVLTGDRAKLVTLSNASAVAVTLPQATSTFGAGWFADFKNKGAGTVTITPTTSTIDGGATLVLTTGQSARIVSDGTNYQTVAVSASSGGSGTVTSVAASGGVETASGSPITGTGTIQAATLVNAQTSTTYTYLTGDRAKLVTHSNASAIAGTLPQATSTFGSGWFMRVKNKGAGTLTITPTTSTIDGASTLTLATGESALIVSDGTNYQVAKAVATGGGGGGGLTAFTDAQSTASPNNTNNISSLSAIGGTTNVFAAIIPKGTGGVIAAIPDSLSTGGNVRGAYAVDLQTIRSSAANVASGDSSFLVGQNNRASGTGSAAMGVSNISSGNSSFAGGSSNTASGTYSFAYGESSTATGSRSLAMGYFANANAADSRAFGVFSLTRAIIGSEAIASGNFSVAGDAQACRFVLRRTSSSATPVVLTTDLGTAAATNTITMPNNSAYGFDGNVIARSSTDWKMWRIQGGIGRGANAAATAVGTSGATVTAVDGTAGASTWALSATANTTLGGLEITGTGAASTSIKWVAEVQTAEVVG